MPHLAPRRVPCAVCRVRCFRLSPLCLIWFLSLHTQGESTRPVCRPVGVPTAGHGGPVLPRVQRQDVQFHGGNTTHIYAHAHDTRTGRSLDEFVRVLHYSQRSAAWGSSSLSSLWTGRPWSRSCPRVAPTSCPPAPSASVPPPRIQPQSHPPRIPFKPRLDSPMTRLMNRPIGHERDRHPHDRVQPHIPLPVPLQVARFELPGVSILPGTMQYEHCSTVVQHACSG